MISIKVRMCALHWDLCSLSDWISHTVNYFPQVTNWNKSDEQKNDKIDEN